MAWLTLNVWNKEKVKAGLWEEIIHHHHGAFHVLSFVSWLPNFGHIMYGYSECCTFYFNRRTISLQITARGYLSVFTSTYQSVNSLVLKHNVEMIVLLWCDALSFWRWNTPVVWCMFIFYGKSQRVWEAIAFSFITHWSLKGGTNRL